MPGEENFDLLGQFEIKAIGDRLLKMAGNPSCDEIAFEERMTPPAYTPALRGSPPRTRDPAVARPHEPLAGRVRRLQDARPM